MNKQEIFDKVATALIKQGKPSIGEDTACSYFNKDGSRCAIGWLVDESVARDFQKLCPNEAVYGLTKKFRLEDIIGDVELGFLSNIQDAHDMGSDKPDWLDSFKREMEDIAKICELDPSALDQ